MIKLSRENTRRMLIVLFVLALGFAIYYSNEQHVQDVNNRVTKIESPCLRYGSKSEQCYKAFSTALGVLRQHPELACFIVEQVDIRPKECSGVEKTAKEKLHSRNANRPKRTPTATPEVTHGSFPLHDEVTDKEPVQGGGVSHPHRNSSPHQASNHHGSGGGNSHQNGHGQGEGGNEGGNGGGPTATTPSSSTPSTPETAGGKAPTPEHEQGVPPGQTQPPPGQSDRAVLEEVTGAVNSSVETVEETVKGITCPSLAESPLGKPVLGC